MDQASRIIAEWSGMSDVISPERIACGAWSKAVGKRLAERTRAIKLVRDRLVVEVEDELWRKNLWSLRYQILKNIEKAIGTQIVADVEFRVMPPRRAPQREESSGRARAGIAGGNSASDDSAEIADPGLRRVYRNSRRREIAKSAGAGSGF
jgi:Dna[CI] antecedent, DciA